VRLGRDEEKVKHFHALRSSARSELKTRALAEEVGNGVAELHAGKMDTDARAGADTEGVEGSLAVLGYIGHGDPARGIESVKKE